MIKRVKRKIAKHAAKAGANNSKLHNTSSNSNKNRTNSSSSSGSDSSDSSGSSSDDSDSDSDNSDSEQKSSGNLKSSSKLQSAAAKNLDPSSINSASVGTGRSALSGSNPPSSNNINNSINNNSNSQLKGTANASSVGSSKMLHNNRETSGTSSSSNLQTPSPRQQNNIKVRNDLMPGSTTSAGSTSKHSQQGPMQNIHPKTHMSSTNPYQGNNGLQNPPGTKPGSSLLASSLQKEDSPGSGGDSSSSGHQTKTKAMLKGEDSFIITFSLK